MTVELGFLASVLLSCLADAIALPRARVPWQRPVKALAVHVAASAFVFALVVGASARAGFAALVTGALVALLSIVSNAKFESLREPFVFTDLSLFSQLFRHPRLYLPFLSIGKVAAIAIGAGFFIVAFRFDRPLAAMPYLSLAAIAAASLAVAIALSSRLPLSLTPADDQARHGFFAAFVAYLLNGLRPATARALRRALANGPFAATAAPTERPDVIVIQSESFFDARRLGDGVHATVLRHFDAIRERCVQYGQLTVPAWGANTMRTEFAMLTGLPETQQGYARFYPYAFIRRPCTTLAAWFKRAGYRTLAIHPYYDDFFGRKRVFESMHFDRFIDIRQFGDAPRVGPYITDTAVAGKIIASLEANRDQPAFVMAITMENHGPLHLESVAAGEAAHYHRFGEGAPWDNLTVYLRHLKNADAMIEQLTAYLAQRRRKAIVCFYGDHVPALPHVFGKLGQPQTTTDYFIWRNYGEVQAHRKDVTAAQLGQDLIDSIRTTRTTHQAGASGDRSERQLNKAGPSTKK
jgi:hypothetical protein